MQAKVRNPRWRFTNRNTYISACTQRSCKIPTAIFMFSKSRNSMELFSLLCDASGSHKSKMAAHKPEVLISQPVHNVSAKFQRRYSIFMFSKSRNSMKLFWILCYAIRSQKSKMAAHKPEILISQPVHNVAAKFQRLYSYFQNLGIQRNYSGYCFMQPEVKNPRLRLTNTGNTHISAYTILRAIPIFSRFRNSMKHFFILCDASRSRKSKMVAQNRKYLYLSLYTISLRISKGYTMYSRLRFSAEVFIVVQLCCAQAEI